MISLCSKSYIIQDSSGTQKISCKGVSKKSLQDPMQKFSDTLFNQHANVSTNMGFRMKDASMFTYSQEKIGFNYFYCKRKVLEDGISTIPLDITLSPWSHKIHLIEKVQDPLSNMFPCDITFNQEKFPSSEHLFLSELCKHYARQDLLEIVRKNVDPCDIVFEDFSYENLLYKDIDLVERKMRFSILLKFSQSAAFRNELARFKDSVICYKQPNYNKTLSAILGVTNKSSLVYVLDIDSISGNNLVGKILMDLCKSL